MHSWQEHTCLAKLASDRNILRRPYLRAAWNISVHFLAFLPSSNILAPIKHCSDNFQALVKILKPHNFCNI
jgi:hypothetical protein